MGINKLYVILFSTRNAAGRQTHHIHQLRDVCDSEEDTTRTEPQQKETQEQHSKIMLPWAASVAVRMASRRSSTQQVPFAIFNMWHCSRERFCRKVPLRRCYAAPEWPGLFFFFFFAIISPSSSGSYINNAQRNSSIQNQRQAIRTPTHSPTHSLSHRHIHTYTHTHSHSPPQL